MRALVFLALAGCASQAPPAASAPASPVASPAASEAPAPPASEAAPSARAASTASPPPTPGYVFIGEIAGTPTFDPKPALEGMKPQLLDCYQKARVATPALRGKLTLQIAVNEAGAVMHVTGRGPASDPGFLACLGDALKAGGPFPRPGGSALVTAPLVFRP